MSLFGKVHTISYSTLTKTMRLSCTVLKLSRVICQKSLILTHLPAFGARVGGDCIRISPR